MAREDRRHSIARGSRCLRAPSSSASGALGGTSGHGRWAVGVGLPWHGLVRHGTARYGTVQYGTVRYGAARYGMVRYGGTVRSSIVPLGMASCGMASSQDPGPRRALRAGGGRRRAGGLPGAALGPLPGGPPWGGSLGHILPRPPWEAPKSRSPNF